jgi:hypothetical protein
MAVTAIGVALYNMKKFASSSIGDDSGWLIDTENWIRNLLSMDPYVGKKAVDEDFGKKLFNLSDMTSLANQMKAAGEINNVISPDALDQFINFFKTSIHTESKTADAWKNASVLAPQMRVDGEIIVNDARSLSPIDAIIKISEIGGNTNTGKNLANISGYERYYGGK